MKSEAEAPPQSNKATVKTEVRARICPDLPAIQTGASVGFCGAASCIHMVD